MTELSPVRFQDYHEFAQHLNALLAPHHPHPPGTAGGSEAAVFAQGLEWQAEAPAGSGAAPPPSLYFVHLRLESLRGRADLRAARQGRQPTDAVRVVGLDLYASGGAHHQVPLSGAPAEPHHGVADRFDWAPPPGAAPEADAARPGCSSRGASVPKPNPAERAEGCEAAVVAGLATLVPAEALVVLCQDRVDALDSFWPALLAAAFRRQGAVPRARWRVLSSEALLDALVPGLARAVACDPFTLGLAVRLSSTAVSLAPGRAAPSGRGGPVAYSLTRCHPACQAAPAAWWTAHPACLQRVLALCAAAPAGALRRGGPATSGGGGLVNVGCRASSARQRQALVFCHSVHRGARCAFRPGPPPGEAGESGEPAELAEPPEVAFGFGAPVPVCVMGPAAGEGLADPEGRAEGGVLPGLEHLGSLGELGALAWETEQQIARCLWGSPALSLASAVGFFAAWRCCQAAGQGLPFGALRALLADGSCAVHGGAAERAGAGPAGARRSCPSAWGVLVWRAALALPGPRAWRGLAEFPLGIAGRAAGAPEERHPPVPGTQLVSPCPLNGMYHYADCFFHHFYLEVLMPHEAQTRGWSPCGLCAKTRWERDPQHQWSLLPWEAAHRGLRLGADLPEGMSFRTDSLAQAWAWEEGEQEAPPAPEAPGAPGAPGAPLVEEPLGPISTGLGEPGQTAQPTVCAQRKRRVPRACVVS